MAVFLVQVAQQVGLVLQEVLQTLVHIYTHTEAVVDLVGRYRH
jgi:hypothetical protein